MNEQMHKFMNAQTHERRQLQSTPLNTVESKDDLRRESMIGEKQTNTDSYDQLLFKNFLWLNNI